MSNRTQSIPLDVLVEVNAALTTAKDRACWSPTKEGQGDYEVYLKAWSRLSWRVEEMLAAQRVEVTS